MDSFIETFKGGNIKKLLFLVLGLLSVFLLGCSGKDGDDGKSFVTFNVNSFITSSGNLYLGCVSGIMDPNGEDACFAGYASVLLDTMNDGTKQLLKTATPYEHNAGNWTYVFIVDGYRAYSGYYTVEVNEGKNGKNGFLPVDMPLGAEDGKDGKDMNYIINFDIYSASYVYTRTIFNKKDANTERLLNKVETLMKELKESNKN